MRAAGVAEVETLDAASILAQSIDVSDGLDTMEQRTLQYLATKILKLTDMPVKDGSIDGNIGRNSLADINSVTGLNLTSKADIQMNTIQLLTEKADNLVTAQITQYAQAEAAEQTERTQAEQVLAAYTDVEQVKNLARGSQEAKDLQTALNTLGYNVGTVDGIAGRKTLTQMKSYLADQAEQNQTPEEEKFSQAQTAIEAMEKEYGRKGIKAIQQAYVNAGFDLGSYGADGKPGKLTFAAIEQNPDITLQALATYIDTTDNERVAKRVVSEKPRDGDAIATALKAWMEGEPSNVKMKEIVKQFTGDVDSHTRNANGQYIALWLQDNGYEDDLRAGQIMEAVMAEGAGHYEQTTVEKQLREALVDGSGRFARNIARFDENFTGSYYKIGQTLQSNAGRTRVENGMETGMNGTASEVLQALFGVDGDYVASRVHFLTGQGTDGDVDTSVEMANGIQLSNAYYDERSGAIYAVVAKGNGCEGNLVVIPVETFIKPKPKPKPKPIVRKPQPKPVSPEPTPVKPDPVDDPDDDPDDDHHDGRQTDTT